MNEAYLCAVEYNRTLYNKYNDSFLSFDKLFGKGRDEILVIQDEIFRLRI